MKGVVGFYIESAAVPLHLGLVPATLTSDAAEQTFKFGVGTALAYFFDW